MRKICITFLAALSAAMFFPSAAEGKSVRKVFDRFKNEDNVLCLDTSDMERLKKLEIIYSITEEVAGGESTHRAGFSIDKALDIEGVTCEQTISLYLADKKTRDKFNKAIQKTLKSYEEMMEASHSIVSTGIYLKMHDKDTISEIVVITNLDNVGYVAGRIPVSELSKIIKNQK